MMVDTETNMFLSEDLFDHGALDAFHHHQVSLGVNKIDCWCGHAASGRLCQTARLLDYPSTIQTFIQRWMSVCLYKSLFIDCPLTAKHALIDPLRRCISHKVFDGIRPLLPAI